MECPACEAKLSEVDAGNVKVDICKEGCAGIWLDWKEIKEFDENHELDIYKKFNLTDNKSVKIKEGPRSCPKCEDAILFRRYYDIKSEVEIDQCAKCSGIWLDTTELQNIRDQYKTEEERLEHSDKWVNGNLKETKEDLNQETADKLGISLKELNRIATDNKVDSSLLGKTLGKLYMKIFG